MKMTRTNDKRILTLVQMGILSAVIILMTILPIGYISYGIVSITIVHIPVIIGAIALGPLNGAILGGVWGVTCWIKAFVAPPSPLDQLIFTNPLVSVVPRILAGLVAGLIFAGLCRLLKKARGCQIISAIAATVGGALTNTVLVLGLMYLLYGSALEVATGEIFAAILSTILTINGLLEIVCSSVITVPVALAILRVQKSGR